MAATLQRHQLNKLCSNPDTCDKAQSILRLVSARTRPGSGFVVKSTVAIPAVCAYLASEQLNTGEVSLHSAISAACVTQAEFSDILKTVRAALHTEEGNTRMDVTYETLVDAYHVLPREDAIACMEDAEAALPRASVLKERYSTSILSCAVFYWVCQLMEEPSVQERALCQTYSIHPKSFKAIVATIDKQCDGIANQIKSYLRQRWHCARASRKTSTPAVTPSKKRTVAFARMSSDGAGINDDAASFPKTPTKKRRVESSSPSKPGTSSSPAKRSSTAAFYTALKGSPAEQPVGQGSESPGADPSTPRRPHHVKVANIPTTPVRADSQQSSSHSQGLARRPVRRRFRPVFLEQQQWCARDPKVERMWAVANTLLGEMGRAAHC